MVARPQQEAIERLEFALKRSKRSQSVRFPRGFVRDSANAKPCPPLSQILRASDAQLKVYLTVRMMATEAPHATKVRPRDLAAMLGVAEADSAGARRASKALKGLEGVPLLRREQVPGHVPLTTVLDPLGTGDPWNDAHISKPWVTIPIDLWARGWLIALSGRAVALLIVLKELTGGRANSTAWVDPIRKRQYGLSDDTWTRGRHELVDAHLLDVREDVFIFQSEPRRRNLYTLHLERLSEIDPGEPWIGGV